MAFTFCTIFAVEFTDGLQFPLAWGVVNLSCSTHPEERSASFLRHVDVKRHKVRGPHELGTVGPNQGTVTCCVTTFSNVGFRLDHTEPGSRD